MNRRTMSGLVLLLFVTAGCATQALGPYEKLAATGQSYAESLNGLMAVAQKAAIDRASAELLDANDFADRADPGFYEDQIELLNKKHQSDKKRIEVFNDIRKHIRMLSTYFTRLNELATTKEVERTSDAIAATADNLNDLSIKLRDQEGFSLNDDQKDRISKVTNYIIGSQQRAALKRRIKADEKVLQQALNTHQVLLEAIGTYMEFDLEVINERLFQWNIEGPFTAQTSLVKSPAKALRWMEERRRILHSSSTLSELKSAAKVSATLKKALEKLVNDDADFNTQLDQAKAEIDAIKTVVETF